MAKILVLGAGMMGSAICAPIADRGHDVRLVGTPLDRDIIARLQSDGVHPGLGVALPPQVSASQIEALEAEAEGVEAIVLGVSSAGVEWAGAATRAIVRPGVPVISVTKGLRWTGSRFDLLPDVLASAWAPEDRGAIHPGAVVGPCIAGELARRVQTCVSFAGRDMAAMRRLADLFRTDYYHIRPSTQLVGLEVCAALKNAFAMAVGFARGINERVGREHGSVAMHNHEAAVFAQAALEMARLVELFGGDPSVAGGLAGVGDLFVTCQGGRTSRLGRWLGLGLSIKEAVEAMEGATLESLDVLKVLDEAIPVLEERGDLGAAELPLLRHLCAIATAGAAADVPFERFFTELEG